MVAEGLRARGREMLDRLSRKLLRTTERDDVRNDPMFVGFCQAMQGVQK